MSFFEKIFGCCERDKTLKKSEVFLNNNKSESESNQVLVTSTKNMHMNRTSFTNIPPLLIISYSSKNNNINKADSKQYDKDKNSAKFIKNLQNTLKLPEHVNNFKNSNVKNKVRLRSTQTVGYKMEEENNNIVITISDMSFYSENNEKKENFSKLLLTGDLFYGKEIVINDLGMVHSKRNKKDGYTVFGLKNSVDISGQLNNDFIINFKKDFDEVGNIDTETGKVFEIKFNKERKEYTLYFINPYLYLYYKINNFLYFYPGREYFLFVGKIFLSINIEKKDNEQFINIQVDNTCKDIENPQEINKKYSFSESKATIKIGRVNCDINICEKFISKIHGIIEFSRINHKFYYKDMSSTNGTTLLVKKGDFLKIKGEMNFKLEDVSFKIQEIP